jgi:hypothetical protein
MSLRDYQFNGQSFNLYEMDGQIAFNEAIRPVLNNLAKQCLLGKETQDIADIDKREYYSFKQGRGVVYFINKGIIPLGIDANKEFFNALLKAAYAEQYAGEPDHKNPSYTGYIYGKCKYLSYRNLDDTIVDRFDFFITSKDTRPATKETHIRHQGSSKGRLAYQKSPDVRTAKMKRSRVFRQENSHFLRVLMYGANMHQRPLFDTFTKTSCEGLSLYNDIEQREKVVNSYTIHHALFVNAKSVHKNGKEPSTYMNKMSYKNLEASDVNEMLGCIVMGEDGHKIIHKTHQSDDIQGWFRRFERGECCWIPYHWVSEAHYTRTTDWLVENIENFNDEDVVSYFDFVMGLTFTNEHVNAIKSTLVEEIRLKTKFNIEFDVTAIV